MTIWSWVEKKTTTTGIITSVCLNIIIHYPSCYTQISHLIYRPVNRWTSYKFCLIYKPGKLKFIERKKKSINNTMVADSVRYNILWECLDEIRRNNLNLYWMCVRFNINFPPFFLWELHYHKTFVKINRVKDSFHYI